MNGDLNRRTFVKRSAMATAGAILTHPLTGLEQPKKAHLPKWKGFNFQDFYSPDPARNARRSTPEEHFKWMSDWGFDFVRLPMSYPGYLNFDRSKPITPDEVRQIDEEQVEKIEAFVFRAHKYNMHVSFNLHRAPGYCVNAGFEEPYNLWNDQRALDDFCFHWEFWANRFKDIPPEKFSFDLLNEPSYRADMNDQYGSKLELEGEMYYRVAKAAVETIRNVNPKHLIIADGNLKGRLAVPELVPLGIGQSCRGYVPGEISHYKAEWVHKPEEIDQLPPLKWPGQVGDRYLSREMLEQEYAPWIKLKEQGVGVHCGECGCYNKTPHDIFLRWFEDVVDILSSHGIGFALWNFSGAFGIINSGRADVDYEDWYGVKLDRKLLDVVKKY